MSRFLVFDSTGKNADDFTIFFQPMLDIGRSNWEIALTELTYTYSMRNVDNVFGNTTFRYSHNSGVTWYTITLPGGIYSISDINNYLHSVMDTNGHSDLVDGVKVYELSLNVNFNTLRVIQTVTGTFRFDFATGNFFKLIGATQGVISSTVEGPGSADINNGTTSFKLNCDIIDNSLFNGAISQALTVFTPDTPPGFVNTFRPSTLIYMPINRSIINSIRFSFTNQIGVPVSFYGEPVTIQMHMKEIGKKQ